jgi:methyltransferase family protein
LPIAGTYCIETRPPALSRLAAHGALAAQATATALRFPDAASDLVTTMDIVENVDDEPVLRELARVLRAHARPRREPSDLHFRNRLTIAHRTILLECPWLPVAAVATNIR